MHPDTRAALTRPATWARLASYLLFYLLLLIAAPVLLAASLAGWIHLLVKGSRHDGMARFGDRLADWLGDVAHFVAGSGRQRPFPFEDADRPQEKFPPAGGRGPAATGSADAPESKSHRPAIKKKRRVKKRKKKARPSKAAGGKKK